MFPVVNFNGDLISKSSKTFSFEHFAILKGEILKESLRLYNGEFLFKERHYFHLMAQMRMARMSIPMHFTPDFFYSELNKLRDEFSYENAQFTFYISENHHAIDFWITGVPLQDSLVFTNDYEIEQYRETHVANGFHQRIHFLEPRNRVLKTYAYENDYQDLILLNEQKSVARAIEGNLFVISGTTLFTPRIEDGALEDVFRNKVLDVCKRLPHLDEIKEESIFPFSLMKADEVFVLKNGEGAHAVSKFRKKEYTTEVLPQIMEYFVEYD